MQRFLYRVQYTYPDATVSYEPVCVVAEDDDVLAAQADVEAGTDRYTEATGATRTLTLVTVAADV